MSQLVHILLPVHNRRELTMRFINCLRDQSHQNYHLILIDDGSTDGTEEFVRSQIAALTVIKGKGNWWWAGSLQQGYNWFKSGNFSSNDLILIINDDTYFKNDFLERAIEILKNQDSALLSAQAYYSNTSRLNDVGVTVKWPFLQFLQARSPENINCLSTRGLFMKLSTFLTIGGFYPKLLPHYLSDYEFTMRAHSKGFHLITDPSLKIWINENTTGHYDFRRMPFLLFCKLYFSRKSMANPVALTFFVALACPWRWKLPNLIYIWLMASWHTFKVIFKVEPQLRLKAKKLMNKLRFSLFS